LSRYSLLSVKYWLFGLAPISYLHEWTGRSTKFCDDMIFPASFLPQTTSKQIFPPHFYLIFVKLEERKKKFQTRPGNYFQVFFVPRIKCLYQPRKYTRVFTMPSGEFGTLLSKQYTNLNKQQRASLPIRSSRKRSLKV